MDVLTKDRAEKLEREILEAFEEDYVGLWEIVRDVEDELGAGDPDEIREVTVRLVRDMLDRGLMRPGKPLDDGGFSPWSLEPVAAANKIKADWRNSEYPSIDGAWFEITAAGEARLSTNLA